MVSSHLYGGRRRESHQEHRQSVVGSIEPYASKGIGILKANKYKIPEYEESSTESNFRET